MNELAIRTVETAAKILEPIKPCSGAVLISGIDTLRPGPLYVMGFNPGGKPEEISEEATLTSRRTIADSLVTHRQRFNDWSDKGYNQDGTYTKLQINILSVFELLGADPRETFSTNALFVRSLTARKLDGPWQFWWNYCWPVHRLFLKIVRPRVVICLGNGLLESAWALMQMTRPRPEGTLRYQRNWENEDNFASSRMARWQPSVSFDIGEENSFKCAVLGLPHPSPQASRSWPLSDDAKHKLAFARIVALKYPPS